MTPSPHAARDEDGLEDSRTLERSLRGVVRCLQRALEEADPPITPVQLWCLRELQEHPGTTVGDVAAAVGVVPSTVSRAVDRLVATGLATRRTGRGDRRQVSLRATARGERAVGEVVEARARSLAAAVAAMDPDDRAALLRGAQALAAVSPAPPAPDTAS